MLYRIKTEKSVVQKYDHLFMQRPYNCTTWCHCLSNYIRETGQVEKGSVHYDKKQMMDKIKRKDKEKTRGRSITEQKCYSKMLFAR